MSLHWASLFDVFAVSLGSAVAVVGLLSLALVGLSARTGRISPTAVPARRPLFSPTAGTALAVACLAAAGGIVLFGLWTIAR